MGSRGSIFTLMVLHTIQERAGCITLRALGTREGTAAYRLASVLLRDLLSLYPGAAAFYANAAVKVNPDMFSAAITEFDHVSRGVTALSLMRSASYLFGDPRGPGSRLSDIFFNWLVTEATPTAGYGL